MIRAEITAELLKREPPLGDSTRKTYESVLFSLIKKSGLENFSKQLAEEHAGDLARILDRYKNPNTKATVYSALYAVTGLPFFQERMQAVSDKINKRYLRQKRPAAMQKVAKSHDEVKRIGLQYWANWVAHPTLKTAQDALIAGLYTGIHKNLPPRRLLDYADLLHAKPATQEEADRSNYVDKGYFIFNVYKTAKTHGQNKVKIPKELYQLIKYLHAQRPDRLHVLFNDNNEKMSTNSLHKKLLKMFEFGVDMLRSIYLSSMYKNTPSLADMTKTAKRMGHTVQTALHNYVKK